MTAALALGALLGGEARAENQLWWGVALNTAWTGLEPRRDLGLAVAFDVVDEFDRFLFAAELVGGVARPGFIGAASVETGWLITPGRIAPYIAAGVERLREVDIDAESSTRSASGWAPFGELGLYLGHGNPEGHATIHFQLVSSRFLHGSSGVGPPSGFALLGVRLLF